MKNTSEIFIDFNAQISFHSINQFSGLLQSLLHENVETVHLIMNSPGGSVRLALGLAHLLMSLPCRIICYNKCRTDSAAIAIYVVSQERICFPEARFFTHSINVTLKGDYSLTALKNEYLKVNNDYISLTNHLSSCTPISNLRWRKYMSETGHLFSSAEALKTGLSTQISTLVIPANASFYSITD